MNTSIFFFGRRTRIATTSVVIFSLVFQLFVPILTFLTNPVIAYANNAPCSATPGSVPATSSQYGGINLDKAATFLADMDDVTGAYYDQTTNQIVFIGTSTTSLPQFDKDDLAVAIRSVIFNGIANPYIYAASNPTTYTDPSGEFPLLLAWAAIELGLSAWDLYSTVSIVSDECASAEDKALATTLAAAGFILPGGGYGSAGDITKFLGKKFSQVGPRGWSLELIDQTISNPFTTRVSKNMGTGNPATAYYTKEGAYVVRDDITGQIVQVGDNINPASWTPDSRITDPYMPWNL